MWNLAITIVSPDGGVVPFYHKNDNADIVLVCNSMSGQKNISVLQNLTILTGIQLKVLIGVAK